MLLFETTKFFIQTVPEILYEVHPEDYQDHIGDVVNNLIRHCNMYSKRYPLSLIDLVDTLKDFFQEETEEAETAELSPEEKIVRFCEREYRKILAPSDRKAQLQIALCSNMLKE